MGGGWSFFLFFLGEPEKLDVVGANGRYDPTDQPSRDPKSTIYTEDKGRDNSTTFGRVDLYFPIP